VRLRLTALYVGLFLASGACLLVITYFLVAQQLPGKLMVQSSTGNATSGTPGTGQVLITGGTSAATACAVPENGTPPTAQPERSGTSIVWQSTGGNVYSVSAK